MKGKNQEYLLNNGKQFTPVGTDDWDYLIIKIEGMDNHCFCIVDGFVHTINEWDGFEEPGSILKSEYQIDAESFQKLQERFHDTCSF